MNDARGLILGTTFFSLSALFAMSGCADDTCHASTHLGVFGGDFDGSISFDIDGEEHVEVLMESEEEGVFPLTSSFDAVSARPNGCGDLTFDGELIDAAGEPVGSIEGGFSTTTGQGTWQLADGSSGNWGIGNGASLDI